MTGVVQRGNDLPAVHGHLEPLQSEALACPLRANKYREIAKRELGLRDVGEVANLQPV